MMGLLSVSCVLLILFIILVNLPRRSELVWSRLASCLCSKPSPEHGSKTEVIEHRFASLSPLPWSVRRASHGRSQETHSLRPPKAYHRLPFAGSSYLPSFGAPSRFSLDPVRASAQYNPSPHAGLRLLTSGWTLNNRGPVRR